MNDSINIPFLVFLYIPVFLRLMNLYIEICTTFYTSYFCLVYNCSNITNMYVKIIKKIASYDQIALVYVGL